MKPQKSITSLKILQPAINRLPVLSPSAYSTLTQTHTGQSQKKYGILKQTCQSFLLCLVKTPYCIITAR